jgi:hypothetical protein
MMEAKWIQPIVDANKVAFQTWFQSVSAMQDQTEKVMNTIWNQTPMMPESSKKMFHDWVDMCKKGREEMKKTVDQGFQTWEQFLASPEGKPEDKAEKAKSSTSKTSSAS